MVGYPHPLFFILAFVSRPILGHVVQVVSYIEDAGEDLVHSRSCPRFSGPGSQPHLIEMVYNVVYGLVLFVGILDNIDYLIFNRVDRKLFGLFIVAVPVGYPPSIPLSVAGP